MKIILLGAPGAGKGTQAVSISEKYGIPQISTGNIIREQIAQKTPMGEKLSGIIESGQLVSDDIVVEMLRERIGSPDCKNGYILDGVPRTIEQAEKLGELGIEIDCVLQIQVPESTIIERLTGRRVCSKCSKTYHLLYNPSKNGEMCEDCPDGKLTTRKDDSPETVRERLRVYNEKTFPLLEYYESRGKVKTVQGQEDVNLTTKLTLEALESCK